MRLAGSPQIPGWFHFVAVSFFLHVFITKRSLHAWKMNHRKNKAGKVLRSSSTPSTPPAQGRIIPS